MTASPDDIIRCRCGRSTYLVPGFEALRTCSKCGYLTSYCKCMRVSAGPIGNGFRSARFSEKVREMMGVSILSVVGTLFAVEMVASPLVAVLGMGAPLTLSAGIFAQWLRGNALEEAIQPVGVTPPPARGTLLSA